MRRRSLLAFLLALSSSAAAAQQREAPDELAPDEEGAGADLLSQLDEPATGDWPEIAERRQLRVLTAYSRTNFFIERGQGRGLEFEAMSWFERWLNSRAAPGGPHPVKVVFVPLPFEELIPALNAGRGDVIAAGMTATEARARDVSFTEPIIENVSEIVVAHKDAPPLASLEDLAGRIVVVKRATSYVASLQRLNETLSAAGKRPVRIIEAPSHLETEDLIELVNAGTLRFTVADRHLAEVWDRLLPDIVLHTDIPLASGGAIAYAVRRDAPELKALLDRFVVQQWRRDRASAVTIFRRYFESTRFLTNPVQALDQADRVRELAPHFQAHADQLGFDWLLSLAQGFQESRLDPRAKSPVGALGVMQLMPATGRELGVRDFFDPAENIPAGIRYLDRIRRQYFSDPDIPPADQVFFSLAGYNAGPNRIKRLRELADRQGLDPNRWFGHVERVVQQKVGSEPVRYVANIVAYYTAYANVADLLDDRAEEMRAFREAIERANAAGAPR